MEDRWKSSIPDKLVTFFKDAIDQILFDGVDSLSDKQKELLLKYKLISRKGNITDLAKGEFAELFEQFTPMSNIEKVLFKLSEDIDFDKHLKFAETKILELKSRRAVLKNKLDDLKRNDPKAFSIPVLQDDLDALDTQIQNMESNQKRINDIHVQRHGHEDIYTKKEQKEKERKARLNRFATPSVSGNEGKK